MSNKNYLNESLNMIFMAERSGISSGEVIFFVVIALIIAIIIWVVVKKRRQSGTDGTSQSSPTAGSGSTTPASATNQAEQDKKIKRLDQEIKEAESKRKKCAAELMELFVKLHKKAKEIKVPDINEKDDIWKRIITYLESLYKQKADEKIVEDLGRYIEAYSKDFPDQDELSELIEIIEEKLDEFGEYFDKEIEKLKEKERLSKQK